MAKENKKEQKDSVSREKEEKKKTMVEMNILDLNLAPGYQRLL